MKIEIVKANGFWNVVAHTASGKAHDCGFKTQIEAREFVLRFYGVHL